MSIVLLIDGYNVIGPVAPPGRGATVDWLAIERQRLLERLVENLAENVRMSTCVVFDAKDAPRNLPARYSHQGIEVQFAVGYPEADDLLEDLIARHPSPTTLTVVSSDRRIALAARKRRAGCFQSAWWLDQLLEGKTPLIKVPKLRKTGARKAAGPAEPGPEGLGPEDIDPIDVQVDAMIGDDTLDELLGRLD